MPNERLPRIPKCTRHKATGQAVVRLNGKDRYLGRYGTATARRAYERLIAEWLAGGRRDPERDDRDLSVNEVLLAYWRFAQSHYVKDGELSVYLYTVKAALRDVRLAYGKTPAIEFGPRRLRAVSQRMIQAGRSRGVINQRCAVIKRAFKWAVSEEMVPVSVHQALATFGGLRRGKTDARETKPIGPIADDAVQATILHMQPAVADMVRFQRLAGCRPSEVCILRPMDVDRSGDVWIYRPASHKGEHRGRERLVLIGPHGQEILRPYLLRAEDAYCFSPAESEDKRNTLRRANRKTPLPPSQAKRRCKRISQRSPRDRYDTNSYRRAIHRACDKALVDRWSPNRIRHSVATSIRGRFGLEAAQIVLGHSKADVTQVYAERDLKKAIDVMREVG